MQLLESSVLGLRAARHVFTDTAGTEVTLFPMVHLAEAGFFQTIHTDAFSHDAVLVEGVRSPIARRITRAYRWMGGALGGLVVQPPWPTSEQTEILHADIPPEQFDAAWRETAAPTRWLFEVAAPVQGLVMRFTSSRASLARSLVTDDLPSRNDVMLWQPAYAGLTRAAGPAQCSSGRHPAHRASAQSRTAQADRNRLWRGPYARLAAVSQAGRRFPALR